MEVKLKKTANTVLAIDPGRDKCGVAVIANQLENGSFIVLYQEVVSRNSVIDKIKDLSLLHSPDVIIMGDGTTSPALASEIKELHVTPVEIVDEKFTTLLARKRYFLHNPPHGLGKLIPLSLQTPNKPYDDYVAILLAERYLADNSN